MKLNKMKIAKLTNNEAKSINGGKEVKSGESTNNKFTCCWCSGGGGAFNCATQDAGADCNNTRP